MRRIRRLLCAIALSALASPAVPAPAPARPSPAEAMLQLRAINHRVADTYRRPDAAYMEALTARDFLLTDSDGAWRDRDAFLAGLRGPAAFDEVAYDDVQVRVFGEVALLHGVFHGRSRSGTRTQVRYTDVYAWQDGRWRLVGVQNTPVKPSKPAQAAAAGLPEPPVQRRPGDPNGDDHEVLAALNASYVQAFRDADVAWYDAHLAADYQVVFGDGSLHDRAAALADFAKPYYADGIADFPLDKVRIRRFGDVALIHAENAYTLKDGRKGVNRYTDVWVKQRGRWWCVAAQITVHQPPT